MCQSVAGSESNRGVSVTRRKTAAGLLDGVDGPDEHADSS